MDWNAQNNLIPVRKALLWLLLSTLLISGTAGLALLYYRHVRDLYANDDTYRIAALVQATPDTEGLKTVYLAELLDLSVDKPSNLYRFNSKDARRKLLASPLIKEAQVKKIRPGMVYVDYVMRKPIAYLTDYSNTAIDSEWVTLPFKPFFTPKRLPEIYLGLEGPVEGSPVSGGEWGTKLQGDRVDLAKEVYAHILENYLNENTYLRRIDVSKAFAPSCGHRQIVVMLEERKTIESNGRSVLLQFFRILRLSTEHYRQALANYFKLQPQLLEKSTISDSSGEDFVVMPSTIIDLRLPQLAYIQVAKAEESKKIRNGQIVKEMDKMDLKH